MQVTPTMRGSFFAGIGLWVLVWALLFKSDEIAQAGGFSVGSALTDASAGYATTRALP